MNIVVLDGYALNPGDLSWEPFKQLGTFTVYDRTPVAEIISRAAGADIILTNKTPVSRATIDALPALRYIGVLATGYNIIDVAAAREKNITVTNVPGYGTDSVAQLTFALLLELCHHAGHHNTEVQQGRWSKNADWCFWDTPQVELSGKTIGIIGYGTIGKKVATIAHGFGMNVLAVSRRPGKQQAVENVTWCSLDELVQNADVISIHCPLTKETEGLINLERLQQMKPTAFLLNTSRGPVINDKDLATALNDGIIAGAGIDVLSVEPPVNGNPLIGARNIIITPHIAWATKEARQRLIDGVWNNLIAYLKGDVVNLVS
ncbi:MAG TPA: D-2-hydroxyacid dehydrogenase [Flavitalea sp.]|nr:D-2-hydroxyacid dehydrogenase [Flavitalea sp.]